MSTVPKQSRQKSRCLESLESGVPKGNAARFLDATRFVNLNICYHLCSTAFYCVLVHCSQKQTNAKPSKLKASTVPKQSRLLKIKTELSGTKLVPSFQIVSHSNFSSTNFPGRLEWLRSLF